MANYVTDGLQLCLDAKGQDNLNNIWEATTGLNATISGGAQFDGTTLVTDGIDDKATVLDNDILSVVGNVAYTFEITVEIIDVTVTGGLFRKGASSNWEYTMYISAGILYFVMWMPSGANVNLSITTSITNGKHHIIVAASTTTAYVWIDNVNVNSKARSGTYLSGNGTSNLDVGWGGSTGTNGYFKGKIYSFRIYNKQLTNAEITQNYNDAMSVSTSIDATITGVCATAIAQPYIPSISSNKDKTVSTITASATAQAYTSTVTVQSSSTALTVTATASTASAQGYVASVSTVVNKTISALAASASAQSYTVSVTANKDKSITAVATSAATAVAYTLTVVNIKDRTVATITATATASAYSPGLTTIENITVTAQASTASAQANVLNLYINLILTIFAQVDITCAKSMDLEGTYSKTYAIDGSLSNTYNLDMVYSKEVII